MMHKGLQIIGVVCAVAGATISGVSGSDRSALQSLVQDFSWAKVAIPPPLERYRGRAGLPDPYPQQADPIGVGTAGIDFWQANHFLVYRQETAAFLYGSNPRPAAYRRGTLPVCEAVADKHLQGISNDRDKALALLTRALPSVMRHPGIPPLGPKIPGDRALDEDGLIRSGNAFCNEQARVFVQMCHYANVPARMVFLFYSEKRYGHVVAEFYADGRWSMADTSWFCVFPGPDGKLMSAAECHNTEGPNRLLAGRAYHRRIREILKLSDEGLVGGVFADLPAGRERDDKIAVLAKKVRAELESKTPESLGERLWAFGLLEYPPRP